MRFTKTVLAAIGARIPEEIWTSEDVEQRLSPLYDRLRLPAGRLELMSGVSARRVWPHAMPPSRISVQTAADAIDASGIDPAEVGCLIHASVCRDFLEPATASRVHAELATERGLRLPETGWVYDVSNACLGIVNGAVQIATLIESGVIRAGVVVGTENAHGLLRQTIDGLNADTDLTRKTIKDAFASLTIGSASAAWVLADERLAPEGSRLVASTALARTRYNDLCRSDTDAGAGGTPTMRTDSERLMAEGIRCGADNFRQLLDEADWGVDRVERSVCHQVGSRHRIAMLEAMGLSPETDPITFDRLGNTGSAALPVTLAADVHAGGLVRGMQLAMLGIGSGINSVMLAARWGQTPATFVGEAWP